MKKSLLLSLMAAISGLLPVCSKADIPMAYYSSLDGKCGEELKTAIHNLVSKNVSMLSYGSGTDRTWWGFYVTDYQMDGSRRQVIDRYSNDIRYFTNRGSSVSGMNIEHSFPKSWWGGSETNAYKDLYNLMPCEQKINSSKSNYGMGVVTNVKTTNGCTKVGTGANGYNYWEPADKWKGEFSRGYMYMATAYQDYNWTGEGLKSLEKGNWPTLRQWAYTLYIKWAKGDPVNKMEVDRNQAVAEIQGNRNPYVDFPNLMEYVWGDSITVPFNLATTVKSSDVTGEIVPPSPGDEKVIYEKSFLGNNGSFTASGTPGIWKVDSKYGWVGTGYYDNIRHAADASIESPELDLREFAEARMEFSHAANFFNGESPENYLSVGVSVDGNSPEYITGGIAWPEGSDWKFISSGTVDLSQYAGHKIKIVFRYTSTTSLAGTWEIDRLSVTASGVNAVEDIIIDCEDENAPVEYYSIDGRLLDADSARGIVIIRQGRKVTKKIIP